MSKIYCSKCKSIHEKGVGCDKKDNPLLDKDDHTKKRHTKTYAEMNEEELMLQKFYNSKAWRKKREEVMGKSNGLCVICFLVGRIKNAVAVHHIKKLRTHYHLRLDDNNLIAVCRSCHEMIEDCCSSVEEIYNLINELKEKKK